MVSNKYYLLFSEFIHSVQLIIHGVAEFPEEDDSSVKATLSGVAKLGIFPVCVLNVSLVPGKVELLLCYNEFGMFVNESGQRTRNIDPTWNHLPFAFGKKSCNVS